MFEFGWITEGDLEDLEDLYGRNLGLEEGATLVSTPR